MAQTMVDFRIDEEVKRKMGSACKDMGLSLSTAFNIFAVKVGNERRIYNVPYRVDKFKSSFPEIRQVKVPIPSEMDR